MFNRHPRSGSVMIGVLAAIVAGIFVSLLMIVLASFGVRLHFGWAIVATIASFFGAFTLIVAAHIFPW